MRISKQEKLFYELLAMNGDLSSQIIDEAISKFTNPRLISLAQWIRDHLLHMESI